MIGEFVLEQLDPCSVLSLRVFEDGSNLVDFCTMYFLERSHIAIIDAPRGPFGVDFDPVRGLPPPLFELQ